MLKGYEKVQFLTSFKRILWDLHCLWLKRIVYLKSRQKTESIYILFKMFWVLLFSSKNLPGVPLRDMSKNKFHQNLSLIVKNKSWTIIMLIKSLKDRWLKDQNAISTKVIFWYIPEGDPRRNFGRKWKFSKCFETYIDPLSFLCWFQTYHLFRQNM